MHRDRCSPRLPGAAGQAPDHGASARRRIGSASRRSRRTRPSPARRGFCAMRTPNVAFRSALMAAFVSLGVIKPDGTARTVRRDPTWDRAAVRTQLKAPRQGRVWELSTTRSPCAGRNATRPRQGSSLGGLGAAPRAGSIPPWETMGHEHASAPQGDDSAGASRVARGFPSQGASWRAARGRSGHGSAPPLNAGW